MTSALRNRGPDGAGEYVDGPVGLFHTRLAVVDQRVTSNQPLLSPDGQLILICNGEIYNYQELLQELNYPYQSSSDCEAVLAVYHAEGVRGFRRLRGMFSFGLYDRTQGRVIVYRDAVGKKPLFSYASHEAFLFSSSVTAIRQNTPGPLTVDPEAVASYIADGYIRPDRSLYREIRPVLPGHLMALDVRTGHVTTSYLAPETTSSEKLPEEDSAMAREIGRLLEQSVERRVRGLQQPVLLFSGGIDSTVLAKHLARLAPRRVTCLALRPVVLGTQDEPYGRYAARRLGLNYLRVGLPLRTLKTNIDFAIGLLDQPLAVYAYYLMTYLARQAREFGNVLFTGDGGDEAFYGYERIRDWFAPDTKPVAEPEYQVGPPYPADLSAWGRRQVGEGLLGHAFVKVDKATAEQQMETRCPYLDWDLMAFLRRIPSRLFLASVTTKPLLKTELAGFPAWFVRRRKLGTTFNFRYLVWPFYHQMRREIDGQRLARWGVTVPALPPSRLGMFRQFDRVWRWYVLSKFLAYEEGR